MWEHNDADDSFEWEFDDTRATIRFTRDGHAHTQAIEIVTTPCRYGGARAWFICPVCGRRVGKVYLPCTMYVNGARATRFWCRHCYGLTYEQRRERDLYWTMIHRAERIEQRWLGEIADDWIGKRKGQHQTTFEKRADEYERALARSDAAAGAGFEKLARRFGYKL